MQQHGAPALLATWQWVEAAGAGAPCVPRLAHPPPLPPFHPAAKFFWFTFIFGVTLALFTAYGMLVSALAWALRLLPPPPARPCTMQFARSCTSRPPHRSHAHPCCLVPAPGQCINITPEKGLAGLFSSFFFGFWNLFCGFLIPQSAIPGWWIWCYW